MPFSLFKKPSTSRRRPSSDSIAPTTPTTIFPSPSTTHAIIAILLHHHHPTRLCAIHPKDIQQFLTERYSSPSHMPWTWLSLTFSLASIKHALEAYPKSNLAIYRGDDGPGWSQRRRLIEFVRKTQGEEGERKRGYRERQGVDAGDAYVEKERERIEGDLEDLERCMEVRRRREQRKRG